MALKTCTREAGCQPVQGLPRSGHTHGLQLSLAQSDCSGPLDDRGVDPAAAHIHQHHKLDPRVGLEAVGREPLIDSVQQSRVAAEVRRAEGEHVKRAREDKRELERRPDRSERVGGAVVGGENGDVKGVALQAG